MHIDYLPGFWFRHARRFRAPAWLRRLAAKDWWNGRSGHIVPLLLCLTLAACGGGHDNDAPLNPPATTGSLAVTVTGLPAGVAAALSVSGPGAYQQTLTASQTLSGLAAGAYTVTATQVPNGVTQWSPTPASQQVTVSAGNQASAAVVYAADASATITLGLQQISAGLVFPVFLTAPPGDSRQFIVERAGRIRILDNGTLRAAPFLDIRSRVVAAGEGGLLSMAFHPQFASNGYFFIYYIDLAGNIAIERLSVSPTNANQADPLSALSILSIPHPTYTNHYGGQVAFGPDGMLYIGTGDGGGAGDPFGNGQNLNALLGKLLRIDVNGSALASPYAIPADNPYAGQAGRRGEIWASGLRNPWRYSFDTGTQLLYIADVGQEEYEEVDIAAAAQGGNNYGWNTMEGSHCYNASTCSQTGLTLPAFEYAHGTDNVNGCSITGGFVYRGAAIPELTGRYLYSDYCKGWLKSFLYSNGSVTETRDWAITNVGNITGFGQDGQNELYLLSGAGGVYRIVRQ